MEVIEKDSKIAEDSETEEANVIEEVATGEELNAQSPTPASTPSPSNVNYSEDDIGVSLDYQPPNFAEHDSSSVGTANEHHVVRTGRSTRSERRRQRREQRNNMGFFQFIRQHWIGQCLSGLFTGLIFFVIGIVFIVYFESLPNYIGILFVLVSFPPCCMALNRWHYARRAQRRRRQHANRREALRRMHRDGEANRNAELQYPDLPPSYDNLGFDEQDIGDVTDTSDPPRRLSLISETAPPTYGDALKLKKLKEKVAGTQQENSSNNNASSTQASSSEDVINRPTYLPCTLHSSNE